MPLILVDMDGVIADFEGGVFDRFKELYPDKPAIPLEERTTFYVKDQYSAELRPLIESIYLAPNFYRNLKPIRGSLEALMHLSEKNDLFICTSPLSNYANCVGEKYDWVMNWMGKDWVKRIILCKDKTLVRGDLLIDDNPKPEGTLSPTWEHRLYTQPYNSSVRGKKRISWVTYATDLIF
jgi:5'-nucleotidase